MTHVKIIKTFKWVFFSFIVYYGSYYSIIAAQKNSIIFSHKLHIEDIGVECVDCHSTIPESQEMDDKNLPKHEECFTCHDDDIASQKCGTCHSDPDNPEPLENPIREFYFNHVFHIKVQNMECDNCHHGLEKVDYAQKENLPSMEQCFLCHDDVSASKRCEDCHIPAANLIPMTHTPDWKLIHKHVSNAIESECMTCHEENYCQDCHTGARLLEVGNEDKDYVNPSIPSSEGKKNMVLQRVHELNYRYTHGIDANDKKLNCSFCHQETQFCVRCHQEEEKINILKPSWHSGPDWGAIVEAVGSGGGRHARLAKRDIERCAACHDSQGEDPVCLMCHRDFLPGRGNDLRTHFIGMFSGAGEGAWHVDEGSICFNCHVNSMTPGVGFCGYCHSIK